MQIALESIAENMLNDMKFKKYANQFLKESNGIEGEEWPKLPLEAFDYALSLSVDKITENQLLQLHKLHEEAFVDFNRGVEKIRFGVFRMCEVRVGGYLAPRAYLVPPLIENFCSEWPEMDAWEAHCEWEKTHPFEDLNGRTGRLLWLVKALDEGYDFSIPFLHMFYYQTLKHYANKSN